MLPLHRLPSPTMLTQLKALLWTPFLNQMLSAKWFCGPIFPKCLLWKPVRKMGSLLWKYVREMAPFPFPSKDVRRRKWQPIVLKESFKRNIYHLNWIFYDHSNVKISKPNYMMIPLYYTQVWILYWIIVYLLHEMLLKIDEFHMKLCSGNKKLDYLTKHFLKYKMYLLLI